MSVQLHVTIPTRFIRTVEKEKTAPLNGNPSMDKRKTKYGIHTIEPTQSVKTGVKPEGGGAHL